MLAEHLSIDGSVVSIEAEADLEAAVTATGWAVVPSLMRAFPFRSSPPGYTKAVENDVRKSASHVRLGEIEEYSLKGGTLRVAEVELPVATGGARKLTVGGWEGAKGCLSTSFRGWDKGALVEAFDSLEFSEGPRGLAIDSHVTWRPREPQVVKEVPGLGILNIQPALPSVLEHVPRSRGAETAHGELFRVHPTRRELLFVSPSAVVRINPRREDDDPERMLAIATSLRVEWRPRRRAA